MLSAAVTVTAQASHTGRLLRYDPAGGRTDELASGMWFANGVALAPDESYAVVAETLHARLLRVWLRGPKARYPAPWPQPPLRLLQA
jgi:sugar lactone lactonase YvrE